MQTWHSIQKAESWIEVVHMQKKIFHLKCWNLVAFETLKATHIRKNTKIWERKRHASTDFPLLHNTSSQFFIHEFYIPSYMLITTFLQIRHDSAYFILSNYLIFYFNGVRRNKFIEKIIFDWSLSEYFVEISLWCIYFINFNMQMNFAWFIEKPFN